MNSESIGKLAAALAKAQGAMRGAAKTAENPHLRSKYADLESCWDACRKPLAENEIAVIQTTRMGEHGLELITTLAHSSGEAISGVIPVLYGDSRGLNSMQAMGSALTYARRYGLCSLVGISPEDDDGTGAGSGTQRGIEPRIDGEGLAKRTFGNAASHGVAALRRAYKALSDAQRQAVAPYLDHYKALAEKADADVITAAQVKALKAAATTRRLDNAHIKAALVADGIIKESTKEIPQHRFADIMDRLDMLAAQGAKITASLPEVPERLKETFATLQAEKVENGIGAVREALAILPDEDQAILWPHFSGD